MADVPELGGQQLLPTVENWLRTERTADREAAKQQPAVSQPAPVPVAALRDPFGAGGRHMSHYRGM